MTKARLKDICAASPLIIFYIFAIFGLDSEITRELSVSSISIVIIMSAGAKLSTAVFAFVQVVLFFIRALPIAKYDGLLPRLTAMIGSNSAALLLFLPSANRSIYLNTLSSVLILAGTIGSVLVISQLGKAFSITPQARALVTSGPYRVIRHPLYLTELTTTFGVMWLYREPWACLIFALTVALQLARMCLEEEILQKTFPAYKAYAAATARLIPGLY